MFTRFDMMNSFPLIFSFGLLPQIDTFISYLLEQIEIHIFGGTAVTTGLTSALYSFSKSIFSLLFLYILALISLSHVVHPNHMTHPNGHQNVMFSIFCGILASVSYLLSRSSSDPTVMWRLLKKFLVVTHRNIKIKKNKKIRTEADVEMTTLGKHHNTDSPDDNNTVDGNLLGDTSLRRDAQLNGTLEHPNEDHDDDPLPKQLEKTLLIRLQSDVIICIIISVVMFAVHVSTIFTLQPIVEMTLGTLCIGWGFFLNYFWKNLRKELPWFVSLRYDYDILTTLF